MKIPIKKFLVEHITSISFLLVVVMFLLQMSSLYNSYQTNIDLLQRELNLGVDEAYQIDLDSRLAKQSKTGKNNFKYMGTDKSIIPDTAKVYRVGWVDENGKSIPESERKVKQKESYSSRLNMGMEEFLTKYMKLPIDLQHFDSIAHEILAKKNINISLYSEVFDMDADTIVYTSFSPSLGGKDILISRSIPLDVKQTRGLRLVLVNPMKKIYPNIFWMLFSSAVLCIICIYSFYFHRKSLSKQRQVVQLKNDLFSDISHEFKKPLSVMLQVVDALGNEKVILDEERRSRYLRIATEEIAGMSDQTEMILTVAMDDEGVLELHSCSYDLEEQVANLVDRSINTSSKSLDIDLVNDLGNPIVQADKERLGHVISNLITNAVKYSNSPVTITIKLYRHNNDVCISVKDKGVGISDKDLSRIFDKYSRVGETSMAKGHGIGLSYVKRIVEKHGGNISVTSELNKGSEFVVRLPQSKKDN